MAMISRMTVGQELYEVRRTKMGNTTLSRGALYYIRVVEIDPNGAWVIASWNGNAVRKFFQRDADKWRVSKPTPKGKMAGLPCY